MSRISVKHTLGFAFGYLSREIATLAPRMLLPALAGGLVFYLSLSLYFMELERYLLRPTDRAGSLVLGVATAGLLLLLFMHSIIATTIASLALDRPIVGWKYFSVSRRVWRVYAAHLRFLAICAVPLSAGEVIKVLITEFAGDNRFVPISGMLVLVGLVFLLIQVGFLLAPVAVASDEGPVVRRAWRLARGEFPQLAAVVVTVLCVGAGVEAIGEFVIRVVGASPSITDDASFFQVVVAYRPFLPVILLAIAAAYIIEVVLATSAATAAYCQIVSAIDFNHSHALGDKPSRGSKGKLNSPVAATDAASNAIASRGS